MTTGTRFFYFASGSPGWGIRRAPLPSLSTGNRQSPRRLPAPGSSQHRDGAKRRSASRSALTRPQPPSRPRRKGAPGAPSYHVALPEGPALPAAPRGGAGASSRGGEAGWRKGHSRRLGPRPDDRSAARSPAPAAWGRGFLPPSRTSGSAGRSALRPRPQLPVPASSGGA